MTRKLPRWLSISLLTVFLLALCTAGVWWWITWPERTAHKYLSMYQNGKWIEAAAMYGGKSEFANQSDRIKDIWQRHFANVRVEYDGTRTMSDVILGRRKFLLIDDTGLEAPVPLTTQRGRVVL